MKTLKTEAVYPMVYESFSDVALDQIYNERRLHSALALGYLSPHSLRINTPGALSKLPPDSLAFQGRTPHRRPILTPLSGRF